jgi:hypothetical protein
MMPAHRYGERERSELVLDGEHTYSLKAASTDEK